MIDRVIPLVIWTLNRYDKFATLMDSLMGNTWADHIFVYVSVDYPPSEKYVDGNNRLIEYIKQNQSEFLRVFAGFSVEYHSRNLGFVENAQHLINKAFQEYGMCITSEDDNVLGKYAIEFLCENMLLFEDNPNVFSVCASNRNRNWRTDGINVGLPSNLGYVVGIWDEKYKNAQKWICWKNIEKSFYDDSFMNLLYNKNPYCYHTLVDLMVARNNEEESVLFSKDEVYTFDHTLSIYQIYNGKGSIFPVESMVRNDGYDGSGALCDTVDAMGFSEVNISDKEYDINENEMKFSIYEENICINYDEVHLRASRDARIIRWLMLHVNMKCGRNRLKWIYLLGDESWRIMKFFDCRWKNMKKYQKH